MKKKSLLYCGPLAMSCLCSSAWAGEPGPPMASVSVPVFSELGLLGLAAAVGVFGVRYFRSRNKRK